MRRCPPACAARSWDRRGRPVRSRGRGWSARASSRAVHRRSSRSRPVAPRPGDRDAGQHGLARAGDQPQDRAGLGGRGEQRALGDLHQEAAVPARTPAGRAGGRGAGRCRAARRRPARSVSRRSVAAGLHVDVAQHGLHAQLPGLVAEEGDQRRRPRRASAAGRRSPRAAARTRVSSESSAERRCAAPRGRRRRCPAGCRGRTAPPGRARRSAAAAASTGCWPAAA